ncbi:MAG TPA: Holliday junction branch migration protein RuvA [Clostridiales bacterium]|nr:Holliday junction branch migration protein RuvA [Clostridiales bacterium]
MIDYIKGKIELKTDETIVVDAGAFGYAVHTSLNTLAHVGNAGDEVKLYTYLHIREDAILLYGFMTTEERALFKMLLSVSGVGPKVAMAVLSVTTPATFGMAVVTDDFATLSKAQGVGKKTAQRIILELKDKVSKIRKETFAQPETYTDNLGQVNLVEAVNALIVLGYTKSESVQAVNSVVDECETLEDLIKQSLKKLTAALL